MANEDNELGINITGNATGVEGASKQAAAAVGSVSKEARDLDAAFRRVKSSIDPVFAATEKYNKALADSQRLLAAGRISQEDYATGVRVAKAALDAKLQSINAGTVASKAAAAAEKEAAAAEKAAQQAATREAQQAAAAKKAAEREAAAAAKAAAKVERDAKMEVRRLAREAAAEVKRLAAEKAKAERDASRAATEAEKQARREQRSAIRAAAEEAKKAAAEKRIADRAAAASSKEAAKQTRDLARAEREASNAVQELRASVDPAFAAQERYNETMRRATSLLMQNKLQQGEWIAIQQQAKTQMDINVRSMGRMNTVYTQLGFQAQDVTASLASGTDPLVILAQQGGQTAAALSMMGGVTGRIAAFFAGPWGAAIIGATMLLGFYLQRTKESEAATKDATNAEDLRRMKLNELTDALRAFNKEQREANLNTSAQRAQQFTDSVTQLREASTRAEELKAKLADARQEMEILLANPQMDESGTALALARRQVNALERDYKSAQNGVVNAMGSVAQARLAQITAQAAALTDEREAVRQRYEAEETKIQEAYAAQRAAADGITDLEARKAAYVQADLSAQQQLAAAKQRQLDAEERIAEAQRKNSSSSGTKAARAEAREAKSNLQDLIEAYNYEQSLAGENFQEILRLQDLKIEATREFYGADSKEALRAQRERVAQERQYQAFLLYEQQQGIEARLSAQEAAATAEADIARIKSESGNDATNFLQAVGIIDDGTAQASKAAQLQELYDLEVAHENRIYNLKMNALQERLALENLPLREKAQINQQIEVLQAQHEQRLAVMAAQNGRQVAQSQNDAAMLTANEWRKTANTIGQSLNSSFQGIWTKTMTWQQAMFNLADQLTYKFVDAGVEILEDWIVKQAMKTGETKASQAVEVATVVAGESAKTTATAAGTAARVGVTAAGTTATTGMTVGSALLSIGADAARAAAGAYAAIAGIPVVGPFLAPAAAGAALVAVMGLGSKITSAAGGQWQVPQDGQLTELHRDEMVLPAWAAKPLRANLTAPNSSGMMARTARAGAGARESADTLASSRGGDNHTWMIQAMDAKSFQKFLDDNPRALKNAMNKQIRNNLGRG